MLQRLGLLIRRLLQHKPVRFILVGGLNTLFGYGLFAGLYLLTRHRLFALVAATVLGVTFNFFTTGRLVFANKGMRALIPFVLVYGVLLLVNAPLLEGMVRIGVPTLIAQAILIPVMATLSYLINHYWVFRPGGDAAATTKVLQAAPKAQVRREAWVGLAIVVVGLSLAVAIARNRLYAQSTDLAQHYELTRAIMSNWAWPAGTPLSSGMNLYPPLAHYLAAVAGLAFGSALVGINAVAVAAMFFCYLLLARTLSVGGPVAAAGALVVVAVGLWLARSQHAAEGFEVYSNFFYAQLVGEAVFLAIVLWMSDEKPSWTVRWAVAAVLTFVSGWLYLITAVEIALAYLAMEALLLIRRSAAQRTFRPAWALPVLTGAVTLPPLVYLHPSFHLMAQVAGHDGALDLQGLQDLVPELAAVLLVVGLLLGLSRPKAERWRRTYLFLAVASCATAAAALLQTLAFDAVKVGSPYAVKKYAFATVTLLVFGLSALAGAWLDGRRLRRPWPALALGLPPVLALVAVLAMPVAQPQRLDQFVGFQKYVKALLRDPRTPRDAFGNTASLDPDFSPFLNLAVNMVDLGMGQANALKVLGSTASDGPEAYALLKTPADEASDDCVLKIPQSAVIALVKLKCGPLSGNQLQFSEDLSKSSVLPGYFASGWSVKEPGGVWSDGPKAEIAVHFDHPSGPLLFSVSGDAFIPSAGYVQHILVSAGDTRLAEWSFDDANPTGTRKVVIPSALIANGDLKLDFAFPDAIRPNAPGAVRRLGFFVTGLSMESLRGLQPGDRIDLTKLISNPAFLRDGWSAKEPAGVWSSGHSASILLPVAAGDADPVLVLEGHGFFPTPSYTQRVKVRAGSIPLAEWTMDAGTPPQPHAIVIPRRLVRGGEAALDFDFPDATSPAAHKVSADPRELAFFVTAVGLKAPDQQPRGPS